MDDESSILFNSFQKYLKGQWSNFSNVSGWVRTVRRGAILFLIYYYRRKIKPKNREVWCRKVHTNLMEFLSFIATNQGSFCLGIALICLHTFRHIATVLIRFLRSWPRRFVLKQKPFAVFPSTSAQYFPLNPFFSSKLMRNGRDEIFGKRTKPLDFPCPDSERHSRFGQSTQHELEETFHLAELLCFHPPLDLFTITKCWSDKLPERVWVAPRISFSEMSSSSSRVDQQSCLRDLQFSFQWTLLVYQNMFLDYSRNDSFSRMIVPQVVLYRHLR